jgi:hypothetical protein
MLETENIKKNYLSSLVEVLEGLSKITDNLSRVADDPVDIRTMDLPNTVYSFTATPVR